mgnify:FL=1
MRIELTRASLPRPASNQVPSPAVGLPLQIVRTFTIATIAAVERAAERAGIEPARARVPHPASRRAPSPAVGLPLQWVEYDAVSAPGPAVRRNIGITASAAEWPHTTRATLFERHDREGRADPRHERHERPKHDQSPTTLEAAGTAARREDLVAVNMGPRYREILSCTVDKCQQIK